MSKKKTNTIMNEIIPLCISCSTIPLFKSFTYTSTKDIILTYKCKCSDSKSVILSNYLEDIFLFSKILLNKCKCGAEATCYCSTCELYICAICLDVHNNHFLSQKKIIMNNKKCKYHHNKPLTHFCSKCNNPICEQCAKEEHINHKVKKYDIYYQEAKKKITYSSVKFEEKISKLCEVIPIDKRKKSIKDIMAVYSFYMNGLKIAKTMLSFDIISSMLRMIEMSLTPHEKKIIIYNNFPHIFLNRPIKSSKFLCYKMITTKTGNILLVGYNSLALYSPNHRLIKEEAINDSTKDFIEFPNKEKIVIRFITKVKIFETDTCALVKEISIKKEYEQDYHTLLDHEHLCLYTFEQIVVVNLNTSEENKLNFKKKNGYFDVKLLNKDAIVLLYSRKFEIYNLITKECVKTFEYEQINSYGDSYNIISDNIFVILYNNYQNKTISIYGFSKNNYEKLYERYEDLQIDKGSPYNKDYFIIIKDGLMIYDINTGVMIFRYQQRKNSSFFVKNVFWLSERYLIVKRDKRHDLYIIN